MPGAVPLQKKHSRLSCRAGKTLVLITLSGKTHPRQARDVDAATGAAGISYYHASMAPTDGVPRLPDAEALCGVWADHPVEFLRLLMLASESRHLLWRGEHGDILH